MGHWNYRLVRHAPSTAKIGGKTVEVEEWYAIHEVYYDGDGNINGITSDPIQLTGDSKDAVLYAINLIDNDIKRFDILDYDTVVGYK